MCFFRAPPRIVRNVGRDISASPSLGSQAERAPRLFWSPILLSDAMRRLALAANDREVEALDTKRTENAHSILRIMSNLFTFSHPRQKVRRVSEHSKPSEGTPNDYSVLPTRRSTVYIKDASFLCGIDLDVARAYVFPSTDTVSACKKNIEIARLHGRIDHERIFNMLQVLVLDIQKGGEEAGVGSLYNIRNPLTVTIMEKL